MKRRFSESSALDCRSSSDSFQENMTQHFPTDDCNSSPHCNTNNVMNVESSCSENTNKDIFSKPEVQNFSKPSLDLPVISDDIDNILDLKAEKTNLSVNNVKNILKNVIMNEDVIEMVCSSLQGKQIDLPFEPKLTRSKTRELRNKNQPLSTVCALPLTDLTPQPITSDCHLLIDKELPDDSSDEEYMPSEDVQSDDDYDDIINSSLINASTGSISPVSSRRAKRQRLKKKKKRRELGGKIAEGESNNPCNEDIENSTDVTFCVDTIECDKSVTDCDINEPASEDSVKETVGHRTRSKLCLSETPLETIEQQFIPPDITCDMYDWNCDNEDWKNFLKEFTQPLNTQLNETNDDDEADPEYNVLADEEEADEDKEELRMDRAVKVSRKELNDLMKELFEYSEMMSNIENEKKNRERAKRKKKKKPPHKSEDKMKNQCVQDLKATPIQVELNMNQRLLLEQQLRQHVQLTTQHYLQTYRHPVLNYLSPPLKVFLLELQNLVSKNSKSICNVTNLKSAIRLIEKWENTIASNCGRSLIKFMEKEVEKSDKCLEQQVLRVCRFPPTLMQMMCESDAFPYPLFLPPLPFYSYNLPEEFVPSEDVLLVLGYNQFLPYVRKDKSFFRVSSAISYAAEFICENMMPVHSAMKILRYTRSQRSKKVMNPIKEFFSKYKVPSVIHYVIPISEKTLVKDHPEELLPHVWNDFLKQRKIIPT